MSKPKLAKITILRAPHCHSKRITESFAAQPNWKEQNIKLEQATFSISKEDQMQQNEIEEQIHSSSVGSEGKPIASKEGELTEKQGISKQEKEREEFLLDRAILRKQCEHAELVKKTVQLHLNYQQKIQAEIQKLFALALNSSSK